MQKKKKKKAICCGNIASIILRRPHLDDIIWESNEKRDLSCSKI